MAKVEAFDLFSNSTVMVEDFSPKEKSQEEWLLGSKLAAMRIMHEELIFTPEAYLSKIVGVLFWVDGDDLIMPAKSYYEDPFYGPPPASKPCQPRYWVAMNQPKRRRR